MLSTKELIALWKESQSGLSFIDWKSEYNKPKEVLIEEPKHTEEIEQDYPILKKNNSKSVKISIRLKLNLYDKIKAKYPNNLNLAINNIIAGEVSKW